MNEVPLSSPLLPLSYLINLLSFSLSVLRCCCSSCAGPLVMWLYIVRIGEKGLAKKQKKNWVHLACRLTSATVWCGWRESSERVSRVFIWSLLEWLRVTEVIRQREVDSPSSTWCILTPRFHLLVRLSIYSSIHFQYTLWPIVCLQCCV